MLLAAAGGGCWLLAAGCWPRLLLQVQASGPGFWGRAADADRRTTAPTTATLGPNAVPPLAAVLRPAAVVQL